MSKIFFKQGVPLAAFILFGSIALALWINQKDHQRELVMRHTETTAEQIRIRIEGLMKAQMASLDVLAQRWVERTPPDFSRQRFLQFADAFYSHYPGFSGINWVNPEGNITWVFPVETNSIAINKRVTQHRDLRYRKTFEQSQQRSEFTITPCGNLIQGGLGFDTFWPLIFDRHVQGYLNGVFRIEQIIDTCLAKNTLTNYWVRIFEDNRLIFVNEELEITDLKKSNITAIRKIHFPGKSWHLDLEPKAILYKPSELKNLPFLIFGLAISFTLSLLLHLLLHRMQMYREARDLALREVSDRKKAQKALKASMSELDKRVKELDCLFSISNLVEKPDIVLDQILQGTVEFIPPAWQYSEIACSRILLGEKEFKTKNFEPASQDRLKQVSDIIVNGKPRGFLEVSYLQDRPECYEGPFLKEERSLINAVGERLGRIIAHIEADTIVRESEEKLRNLYESSIDGIARFDMEGNFIDVNDAFLRMVRYSKEEVKKTTFQNLTPAKWQAIEANIIENQIKSRGYSDVYEKEYFRKDKALVPVSIRTFLVKDEQGGPIGMWSFIRDITEQKLAEETIRKGEQSFRDLVENSLTGISIIQNNQIIYQNPEQERFLGPLPRAPQFTDIQSLHPEDIEKVGHFYDTITSGTVQSLETDFRFYPPDKLDGKVNMKWVNCRASLVEYQSKEAILVNMMDITTTKELEHLLSINDKMISLGRVAAGIAHEIRNPLSGINIYLNTLEKIYNRGDSLDKVKGILEQIQSASRKIETVIRRVMDFSKPGAPHFVMSDINHPIDEAISLSSVTLRKRGIKIEKVLNEKLPQYPFDPQLIEQVILNLINNASESMKMIDNEKIIEITSYFENNRIIVRVSDSGPGIPTAIKDKVFDPFYSTKDGSTGIGLSICHRMITDHGGLLTLSKSKWGGAMFTIELPIEKGI